MTSDRKAAVCLLGFCGLFAWQTMKISPDTLPGTPSPRAFPTVMLVALTALSLALLLKKDHGEKELEPLGKAMCVYLSMCAGFVAIYILGFPLGAAAGLFLFFQWTVKSKAKSAVLSVVIAVCLFVMFRCAFGIKLPNGIIF